MEEKQLYIVRSPEGEDLYTVLQRQTLAELQRLSGEVWTDYNPHDPGVTIADAANYALTEMDYKLGFALEDYLACKDGTWLEEKYGLFPPQEVYPSAPVTADDYRRLVLARFPMVENVRVEADMEACAYNLTLRLSPFFRNDRTAEDQVCSFLNCHRNLCEQFGVIGTEQPEELFFHADFEIEAGNDVTDILVQIYWSAMQYLSGSVEIKRPAPDGTLPMNEDEWYDGPVDEVRVEIPEQSGTEHELYWRLTRIPGIVSFKTCYFKDKDNRPLTDFGKGYSLRIPDDFKDVVARIGTESVYADKQRFRERLQARYFMRSTFRARRLMAESESGEDKDRKELLHRSAYRPVYEHSPLANDLPACAGTSERNFRHDTPEPEKARIRNFGSYLRLFDLLIQRGLSELDGIKKLLSIDGNDEAPSRMETLRKEILSMRKSNDRYCNIMGLRCRYMDFLDGLYGVDSTPKWLLEFEYYGLTADDRLRRRMRFLKAVPRLIHDRSRSFDITGTYGGENIPAVKRYLSLLLDFNPDEQTAVGNILPGHNLILMGAGKEGDRIRRLMSSQMIDDDVFVANAVEAIKENEAPKTEKEKLEQNEELRRNLAIFNSNWISGSLFREGIALSNYNLVKLDNSEWLLVFRGKEESKRMNLGRSDNKKKLSDWANTLCRYLRSLNRQCEAVYVVEKGLFDTKDPFTVMLVFTGWTARTHSPRFREACTQLARSVMPAHLKMETYWLGALQMQYFEDSYKKWRDSLRENAPEEIRTRLSGDMISALSEDFIHTRKRDSKSREHEDDGT